MISCDLFPRYLFIRMAKPEKPPGFDDNLLGREMDLLGNQAPSEQERRQERRLGTIGLDHGNFLFPRKVVTAVLALPGSHF